MILTEKQYNELRESLVYEVSQRVSENVSKKVGATVRWYLSFMFGVVLLVGGVVGWTAVQTIENSERTKTLEINFGYTSSALLYHFPDNLVFESNAKKYSNTRGATN